MTGFVFGEVASREQEPWGYDGQSDLPKSHPWYPVAAGMAQTLSRRWTAGAWTSYDSLASGPNYTVPVGKTAYLCEALLSARSGPIELDVWAGGDTTGLALVAGTNGGTAHVRLATPIAVEEGDVIGFKATNAGAGTYAAALIRFVVL